MSSQIDTNGELVRTLFQRVYVGKDFDAIDELYAPDAVRHGGLRGVVKG